jgi:hypothetical protein
MGRESNSTRNSFALKILTLKSSAIKILQTLFANPAPSKAFQRVGEGDTRGSRQLFQTGSRDAQVLFQQEIHHSGIPRLS